MNHDYGNYCNVYGNGRVPGMLRAIRSRTRTVRSVRLSVRNVADDGSQTLTVVSTLNAGMGHIDEDKFAEDFGLPWLRGRFPNGTLRREEWLGDTDKSFVDDPTDGYADVWVTPDTTRKIDPAVYLAVEIGNDDTVRDECAQAVEYASVHDRAVPYVILPANHADPDTVEAFRCRGVVVIELET